MYMHSIAQQCIGDPFVCFCTGVSGDVEEVEADGTEVSESFAEALETLTTEGTEITESQPHSSVRCPLRSLWFILVFMSSAL